MESLDEIGKLEMISRVQSSDEMQHATNRYFLINSESERYQMIQAMESFLNE